MTHQRAEPEARFLARVIPERGRVVGFVYSAGAAARTSIATAAIASAIGLRREHTLLVATESGEGTLDGLIGGDEGPGLAAALAGEARLTEIAQRGARRPYLFLPAGRSAPRPEELIVDPRFRSFAERVRRRSGTLLLHLPETALPLASELLDGYVSLGTWAGLAPSSLEEYGRVLLTHGTDDSAEAADAFPERAEPTDAFQGQAEPTDTFEGRADPGASGGAKAPTGSSQPDGRWRRHRSVSRAPLFRSAMGGLLVLLLVAGWWVLSRESIAGPRDTAGSTENRGATRPSPEPVASGTAESATVGAREESRRAGAEDARRRASLATLAGQAPELPYSVLIASYARASDAEKRVSELRRREDAIIFIAPTPVRGRIYHRVFAGALAEPTAARALMDALVASGRKEAASPWDVRPARMAFRLGLFGTPSEAEAAERQARIDGVPAYILPAAAGQDTAYQLYAGAYESAAAARAMEALLEAAGQSAELLPRRGLVR